MSDTPDTNSASTIPPAAPLPAPVPTSEAKVKVSYFHWPTMLLALVILICGIVIGSGATAVIIGHRVMHAIEHPEEGPTRNAARLKRVLHLSDTQGQQVEQIFTERQQAFTQIYRDNIPRIAQELQKTKQLVDTVLTDQQRTEWHKRFSFLEKLLQPRNAFESR